MKPTDVKDFESLMAEVADCYDGKPYPVPALKAWFRELSEHPFSLVQTYLRNWIRTSPKKPVIADIVKPLADRLSSQIEARAQANKVAVAMPTPVTPYGEKCLKQIRLMLSNPKPQGRWWAYELRDKARSGEKLGYNQIRLAKVACGDDWDTDRPYLSHGKVDRVPGEDDE